MLMGKDRTRKTRVLAVLWKWLISRLGLLSFLTILELFPSSNWERPIRTDWHRRDGWYLLVYDCTCDLFGWSFPACFWCKHLLPMNLYHRRDWKQQQMHAVITFSQKRMLFPRYSAQSLHPAIRHSSDYNGWQWDIQRHMKLIVEK